MKVNVRVLYNQISFILCASILYSCTEFNVLTLSDHFEEERNLFAQKDSLNSIISPIFLKIKKNSLFISCNDVNSNMLYQYKIPELKCIDSTGTKGYGHDEFQLYPVFCNTQTDNLYIWGYTPFEIREFDINNFKLQQKRRLFLEEYESFNQMHIIKDSILIYSAIPDEFAIKKYDLINKKQLGKIKIKRDRHKETYFYKNRGWVAANDSCIIYAYVYKKQIDIYSVNKFKK